MRILTRIQDTISSLWSKIVPWAKENKKAAALGAAVLGCGAIAWVGGSVLMNGLIAGLLVSAAVGVLVWKTKDTWLYKMATDHPLISDVIISLAALAVAPAGITGWVSATVAALIASVWLLSSEEHQDMKFQRVAA